MNNQSKPTIFFVWNFLEWGGGQIYLLAIMKEAKLDWNIKVLLPTGSSAQIIKFIQEVGVEYEFIDAHLDLQPAPTIKRKLERRFRKMRAEYRTLRRLSQEKYDILHIDIAPWQSLPAMLYLLSRSGVFVTMHNRMPDAVEKWRLLAWKLNLALLTKWRRFNLFASNQDTKNSLQGLVSETFRNRVAVTYTAVDRPQIARVKNLKVNRSELLQKYELPNGKFLVFCVGQWIDRKGRWTFLEAAQKLLGANQDVFLVWITNSKITVADWQRIDEYQVSNFKLFEADRFIQERDELLTLIAQADLFVLPSYVEGLPIALLEAMALEVPSISTNVNAIPEAITHQETGWLIDPGDSQELADAISKLAGDKDLRKQIAVAGSHRVLNKFTEEISAQTAIREYQSCL